MSESLAEQQRAYAKWAQIYDHVYVGLLAPAQRVAAERAAQAGPRILEVGVGTGLMFRHYPAQCEVVGADLSLAMLRRARKKIETEAEVQALGLCVMDATRLALKSESFNAVTFPFVLTLVPDPESALDEACRVLKAKGRIVIASRFGAEKGAKAEIEKLLAPSMRKIGWSSTFKVSRIQRWAEKSGTMKLVENHKGPYFRVITLEKRAAGG